MTDDWNVEITNGTAVLTLPKGADQDRVQDSAVVSEWTRAVENGRATEMAIVVRLDASIKGETFERFRDLCSLAVERDVTTCYIATDDKVVELSLKSRLRDVDDLQIEVVDGSAEVA